MTANDIVQRMIYLRKTKKWSQRKLSRESGVALGTIRHIEQGKGWSSKSMDSINNTLGGMVFGYA